MEQAEDHLPVHILHRVEVVVPVFQEVLVEAVDQDHQVIPQGVADHLVVVQVQGPQVHHEAADDNRSD